MEQVVFWQDIITPHMYGLAQACAKRSMKVAYLAEHDISEDRRALGWHVPRSALVETIVFRKLDNIFPLIDKYKHAIHIVQGIHANGSMEIVRRALCGKKIRWGSVFETVDERSRWKAPLKRMIYRTRLANPSWRPDFVLAIGEKTPEWVINRGYPAERTFSFAYFLSMPEKIRITKREDGPFRIGYVGKFISRKRIDLLITALTNFCDLDFTLVLGGSGPLHEPLLRLALQRLGPKRVEDHGILPMARIPEFMAKLDCLVLPSYHDGWGAVIIEAMMQGVPVICSDACGASVAVRSSGRGAVFGKEMVHELKEALQNLIKAGPLSDQERRKLAEWARCFSSRAGADYLHAILRHVYEGGANPIPPWEGGQNPSHII